jgi:protein pelota
MSISKVQHETATGSVSNQRVHITICVVVLDVHFDVEACGLRVKGRNVEENDYIKVASGSR